MFLQNISIVTYFRKMSWQPECYQSEMNTCLVHGRPRMIPDTPGIPPSSPGMISDCKATS